MKEVNLLELIEKNPPKSIAFTLADEADARRMWKDKISEITDNFLFNSLLWQREKKFPSGKNYVFYFGLIELEDKENGES